MSASESSDRNAEPTLSDPLAGSSPEVPSDPEPESHTLTSSNDGKALGREATEVEEKQRAEDLPVKSESGEVPAVPAPPQSDLLAEVGVKIEPGLETEGLVDGGVQTPPAGEEAAEQPKTGLEMVMVPPESLMPDWLPAGWTTEVKVRTSGITAGTKDKYFYDPVSRRRFRSKKEVMNFLETGKLGRYKPKTKISGSDENSTPKGKTHDMINVSQAKTGEFDANVTPSSSSRPLKRDRPRSSSKLKNVVRFDYDNCPEKVRWVLTNAAEGAWKPFIGGEEVSDSNKKTWAAALEVLTSGPVKFQD